MAHGRGRRGPVTQSAGDTKQHTDVDHKQMSANVARMESPLYRARTDAKLSQARLAELAHVAQTTVSRVENLGAAYETTPLDTARRLADALGMTIETLFPRTGRGDA